MSQKISAEAIHHKADNILRVPAEMRPSMAKALRPQVKELAAQLNTQHEWLFANEGHPRFIDFENQWLSDLHHYEAACDVLAGIPEQKAMVA
jgi:muconolactone delta-isomerase